MHMRRDKGEVIASAKDCLKRWKRRSKRDAQMFRGSVDRIADLANLEEDEGEVRPGKTGQHERWNIVRAINKRVESKLVEIPPSLFFKEVEEYEKMIDNYVQRLEE
ncbi:hypothetical protein RvY_03108 [Ramazzottius varieornatus]|uniref:Uncharacterized protein n=1 Tax=Ramazzottius varieornatus TaxID=947166 RepID=A0A1D1UQD7_RAMVA|nr:hypothetical protein RvY_03108 [Ramazzottius varieornatus]